MPDSLLLFLRRCLQVKLFKMVLRSYIVRTMKTAIEKTLGGALAAAIIATANVHADDPIRLARYTLQSATAEASQLDLLAALIEIEFPPQIETAGAAIDYVSYYAPATAESKRLTHPTNVGSPAPSGTSEDRPA